jgi:hypothetical protein
MHCDEKGNYSILKHKDDLSAAKKICIVEGKSSAEMTVDRLTRKLTDEQIRAGWRYYLVITAEKAPSVKKAPSMKSARVGRKRTRWSGR